jgi:hypothetical protein
MASRELEGLSMKLKNARFYLICRSYGDKRNSFHLKKQKTQKTSSNTFSLENKRKLYHVR